MKHYYLITAFVSSSLFVFPKSKEELYKLLFTWVVFLFLVAFGSSPRIILNKEKEKAKNVAAIVFKTFVFALFVCFISREALHLLGYQRHEIWAIPLLAFSSEIIVDSYGRNIDGILKVIWEKLKRIINDK